jgi:hypothetical protein
MHPDLGSSFIRIMRYLPLFTTFTATITNGSEYQNLGY